MNLDYDDEEELLNRIGYEVNRYRELYAAIEHLEELLEKEFEPVNQWLMDNSRTLKLDILEKFIHTMPAGYYRSELRAIWKERQNELANQNK